MLGHLWHYSCINYCQDKLTKYPTTHQFNRYDHMLKSDSGRIKTKNMTLKRKLT